MKYFKLAKSFETSRERIYSYQQVGEIKAAQSLLDKAKSQLKLWRSLGATHVWTSPGMVPIDVADMEIAFLEGDSEKAITSLKNAMTSKYIISFKYKELAMYKKLREHPEWPALLAESDKRAAVQREIYLKLVAEGSKTSL